VHGLGHLAIASWGLGLWDSWAAGSKHGRRGLVMALCAKDEAPMFEALQV